MNKPSKLQAAPKHPGIIALLIFSVLATLAIMVLSEYKYLPEAPDKITYDWRTAFFSDAVKKQRKDIAVILVTDDSIAQYWSRSPIDRAMLAELVKAVDAAEPAAIGLDFIFDRPAEPHKQEAMLNAMKNAKAPIIIGALERPEGDRRIKGMREKNFDWQDNFIKETGKQAGHIRFKNEQKRFSVDDQVIRFLGAKSNGQSSYPSFAELLAKVKNPNAKSESPYIAWLMELEKGGQTVFPRIYVSEHKPVDGTGNGDTLLPEHIKGLLKDKIVLIGADLVNLDQHLTPFSVLRKEKIPGVLIHAQIVAQLIDGREVFELNKIFEIIAVLLIVVFGFYLAFRFNLKRYDFIMGAVGITVLIALGVVTFHLGKTIIPSTTFSLAWILGVWGGHLYRSYYKTPERS
ncbi:MAG: CHASE2 domain-containing protein [Methyloligellaceae bacterium]